MATPSSTPKCSSGSPTTDNARMHGPTGKKPGQGLRDTAPPLVAVAGAVVSLARVPVTRPEPPSVADTMYPTCRLLARPSKAPFPHAGLPELRQDLRRRTSWPPARRSPIALRAPEPDQSDYTLQIQSVNEHAEKSSRIANWVVGPLFNALLHDTMCVICAGISALI